MDQQTLRAWVDVDLDALRRNAQTLVRRSGRQILPMVKADAYGVGAVAVCRALGEVGVWGFGVGTVEEARTLRAAGIEDRLVVFTPLLDHELPTVKELRAIPTLGSEGAIRGWHAIGGGPWHLAIDTGMNRAGIEWWRVRELVDLIRRHPPTGAFTHFHSADDNAEATAAQLARFREVLPPGATDLHVENSAAIEHGAFSDFPIVRPGVFLYGVTSKAELQGGEPDPVIHLRARVVEKHLVRAGESVSYGATWRPERDAVVATLAIGYADGYRRAFSNCGEVIVRGRRVRVVGRVTMDMTMVDVTGVDCELGDSATLMGRDGSETVDINAACRAANVFAYEFLVGLRLRAARRYHGART